MHHQRNALDDDMEGVATGSCYANHHGRQSNMKVAVDHQSVPQTKKEVKGRLLWASQQTTDDGRSL